MRLLLYILMFAWPIVGKQKYPKRYASNVEIVLDDARHPENAKRYLHPQNIVTYTNDSTVYIVSASTSKIASLRNKYDTLLIHKHRRLVSKTPLLKKYLATDNFNNTFSFYEYIDTGKLQAIAGEFSNHTLCVFIIQDQEDL